jgi:lipoyl(octanoyl) transferase
VTERLKVWRLLIDGARCGADNMARDEALARCAGNDAPAALRLYSFDPPAITIGRFQKVPSVIDAEAFRLDVVRRPTGGLAILHSNDFTYSVVMPSSGFGLTERERVFDTVARGITNALANLGIEARQVSHMNQAGERTDWCFEGVLGVDLQWRGRKICGSAQKIIAGCVLQHGSVFLSEPDYDVRSIVMSNCNERSKQEPFVTIREAAGREVSSDEILEAFQSGFQGALGVVFEPCRLTAEEEDLARRLSVEKYADNEWLRHPERAGHVGRL